MIMIALDDSHVPTSHENVFLFQALARPYSAFSSRDPSCCVSLIVQLWCPSRALVSFTVTFFEPAWPAFWHDSRRRPRHTGMPVLLCRRSLHLPRESDLGNLTPYILPRASQIFPWTHPLETPRNKLAVTRV